VHIALYRVLAGQIYCVIMEKSVRYTRSLLELTADAVLSHCSYNNIENLDIPTDLKRDLKIIHKRECSLMELSYCLYLNQRCCRICYYFINKYLEKRYFEIFIRESVGPVPYSELLKLAAEFKCQYCGNFPKHGYTYLRNCRCEF